MLDGSKGSIIAFFLCVMFLFLYSNAAAQIPPIPETAQFSIDLADIYAEIIPQASLAEVMCNLWLIADGQNPIILRVGGNIQTMRVASENQLNLTWLYEPPHIYLYNINPGSHRLVLSYVVKHDGFAGSGVISPTSLILGADSWWYPRNVAPDPHQVILNLVSPDNYSVFSSGTTIKDVPNNLKRLRQFVLSVPSADGLTLSSSGAR